MQKFFLWKVIFSQTGCQHLKMLCAVAIQWLEISEQGLFITFKGALVFRAFKLIADQKSL